MTEKQYDVFGVGNALVDTLVTIDEQFLVDNQITKGVMTLVDSHRQGELLAALSDHHLELRSGGSAANTMVALANCGGTGCYTGKVANDTNGEFYKLDMEKAGIFFEVEPASAHEGYTGTCVVLTTPDADRTMLTHLGISTTLSATDIDSERLHQSQIAYVEGYLWDGDSTKQACVHTMELAKQAGITTAFTYSDPFCVNRSRDDFEQLTRDYVDIVFCNHEEAIAFSGQDDPEQAIQTIGKLCSTVFMTWGAKGAIVCHQGSLATVPAFPVQPIDTNGAGDAFAAGTLYGLTHGYSLTKAARWGNYIASRMILEIGARLSLSLKGQQDSILQGFS